MRRLESKLVELGLSERRDSVVGSPVKKTLSGGERKRLNIGLDMKIISPTLFAMLVFMALVTTFATTPALNLLTRHRPWVAEGDAKR